MKPQAAVDNWRLDGDTITVTIPMAWKRRGGRKVIIAPDGGDAWAPAKPRPDETLIRALARAHRWKRVLEEGTYRSAAEIAEAEGITRSFVNRLLRLTLLAPDIQEAILDGRQTKGMQLEDLTKPLPSAWEEQRKTVLTTG
jgi:ParB-like chromosome segregation protein Spo0J